MATIRELSDGVAGLVTKAAAYVVEVRGRRRPATGIVWSPERVVTAAHVLHREENLVVVLPSGEERAAALVGRDPGTDLALLRVPGLGVPLDGASPALTEATWVEPDTVAVGALVFPLGRREGRVRAALGIVAERAGAWNTAFGGSVDAWIDVEASLPPGFSGGPLVDADGAVIGLNTSGLTPRGAVIPRSTVARVVDRLERFGTAAPGYLGAGFYPGTLPDEVAAVAQQPDALMCVSLEPSGPALAGGLQVGDALVRLDGQPVGGVRQLLGLLSARGAGADVVLTVVRGGALTDVPVKLGARPRPRFACG